MVKLAIFASGGGSNAEAIIDYFKNHKKIQVELVVSNNKGAFVLQRAINHKIEFEVLTKKQFKDEKYVSQVLRKYDIEYIVLAGFLLLIPNYLIKIFPKKIVNIHPALLPKYGGKGMYGHFVHEAVYQNSDNKSGISIHYVNDNYDEGQIIFQATCDLESSDGINEISSKVLKLEHRHYAEQIEKIIQNNLN